MTYVRIMRINRELPADEYRVTMDHEGKITSDLPEKIWDKISHRGVPDVTNVPDDSIPETVYMDKNPIKFLENLQYYFSSGYYIASPPIIESEQETSI